MPHSAFASRGGFDVNQLAGEEDDVHGSEKHKPQRTRGYTKEIERCCLSENVFRTYLKPAGEGARPTWPICPTWSAITAFGLSYCSGTTAHYTLRNSIFDA